MRSPDSMRGRPREPIMSPHNHPSDAGSTRSKEYVQLRRQDSDSSSQGDGDSSRGGSQSAPRRSREHSMWPNPWLRRNWDPKRPLDLNKPIKDGGELSSAPLESEDLATRTFDAAFAMDLNNLVQSLWVPKRPPPSPDMKHRKDLQNVRSNTKLRRQRSGSPTPPQLALSIHAAPSSSRDVRRHEPRYDDRKSLDILEPHNLRVGRGPQQPLDVRAGYDAGPQSRKLAPSSRDEARSRRHADVHLASSKDTEHSRNPLYDPGMEPQYTPHQYDPPTSRRAARPHYPSYDSRPSATGYFGNYVDDGEQSRSPVFSQGDPFLAEGHGQRMHLFDSEIAPPSRRADQRDLDTVDWGRLVDRKRSNPRLIDQRGKSHAHQTEALRNRRDDTYEVSPGDARLRRMISEPRSFEYEKRLPLPSSRTRHHSDQDFDDVLGVQPSIRTRHYSEHDLDEPPVQHSTGRGRQYVDHNADGKGYRPGYLSAQPKPQPYQPPPSQHRRALAKGDSNSDEEVEF